MKRDGLGERLRGIPVPRSGDARDQAVAEARAEIAARGGEGATSPGAPGRLLSALAALVLVAVLLVTPPGRAAAAWVGDLVGLGEVGGPPTQPKRTFADSRTAVVIDNGTAPDGSRYEWVAYECSVDLRDEGSSTNFEGIGMSFEWPGVKGHEGGGVCEELEGRPRQDARAVGSHGVHILPSQFKGVEQPDLVVAGTAGAAVHRVEVIYTAPDGTTRKLPVDFARVEGRLQKLAHRPEAMVTWTAFLPGEVAARDEVETRLDLRAVMTTDSFHMGPIARRERELAQRARERCEHLQPSPADLQGREPVEPAFRPLRECLERHMPPSPFTYVAYDEDGRELSRMSEPLISASYQDPDEIEPAGREAPGAERVPWRAPRGESTKVMAGRTPEGTLYEVVLTPDDDVGPCTWLRWPFVEEELSGGACGGFPPETAFGRREPEKVAARPYGFLEDHPHATRFRVLSGFARPSVESVRIVYRDADGARRDAALKLAQVREEGIARVGYWVAFVPRTAGRHPMLEVIAYGADGEELSRIDYRG
jgi:hypothetical protein